MAAPAAEPKVGLMAVSVSSRDRRGRPQPLQRRRPHFLLSPVADHRPGIDTGCPTSGGQFTGLVGTILAAGAGAFKVTSPDAYPEST